MKKLLFVLFFFPLIGFGQGQFNCSLLSVTDVFIDSSSLTIDIGVYNGNAFGASYPFVAYTIDRLGDTLHTGNVNLFGIGSLDTSWYSYAINTNTSTPFNLFYPLNIYFVYGIVNTDTCVIPYNPSCDSVSILFNELDTTSTPSVVDFDVQTLGFHSTGSFGYAGFFLLDNLGDTVAYEDFTTASNVYGLMPYNIENRIMAAIQNIDLPFDGFLHLSTGWFAGSPMTSCVFPLQIAVTTDILEQQGKKNIVRILDLLGREIQFADNNPFFIIYDDGTVEKKLIFR